MEGAPGNTAAAAVNYRMPIWSAAAAAVGLAFLLTYPGSLLAVYGALILAGVGAHGTQCLVIAAVAGHCPSRLGGSALGFALGIGRIGALLPQVGGWLLDAKLGVGSNFLDFAAAAGVAGVLLAVTLGRTRRAQQAVDTGDATSTRKSAVAADALVH